MHFPLAKRNDLYYNIPTFINSVSVMRRAGPVRRSAVNHVRRGTEQH